MFRKTLQADLKKNRVWGNSHMFGGLKLKAESLVIFPSNSLNFIIPSIVCYLVTEIIWQFSWKLVFKIWWTILKSLTIILSGLLDFTTNKIKHIIKLIEIGLKKYCFIFFCTVSHQISVMFCNPCWNTPRQKKAKKNLRIEVFSVNKSFIHRRPRALLY